VGGTLDLLTHVSDRRRQDLAQSVGRRQDDVLDSIVAAAVEHGMWPELLPLIPELPADAQQRVARAAAVLDPSLDTLDDLLGEPGRRLVTERQVHRRL
jgi:hypothetical protein